jgi:hypothetical protein
MERFSLELLVTIPAMGFRVLVMACNEVYAENGSPLKEKSQTSRPAILINLTSAYFYDGDLSKVTTN